MKTQTFSIIALLTASVDAAPSTCFNFTDPKSPMTGMLAGFAQSMKPMWPSPKDKDPSAQNASSPDFSSDLTNGLFSVAGCLGSINVSNIEKDMLTLVASEQSCARAALSLMPLYNAGASLSNPSQKRKLQIQSRNPSFQEMLNISDASVQSVCKPMLDIIPCIERAVIPYAMGLLNGSSCCSPVLTGVTNMTGEPLDRLVSRLLRRLANIACSTEAPGFGVNQTCGFTLVKSFAVAMDSSKSFLEAFMQIPNDQGCSAISGLPFSSTTGANVSSIFIKPFVPSVCAQPMDSLVQYIASFPFVQQITWKGIRLLDLLTNGKCIRGDTIALAMEFPSGSPVTEWVSRHFNASQCYHIANGMDTCPSNGDKLQLFTTLLGPSKWDQDSSGQTVTAKPTTASGATTVGVTIGLCAAFEVVMELI
ncbi:unnamed protein product [Aphanomyces euteiches]|uniref:Secreted protein n=1 Tax=Aphanomyces euteiches TaxID=100861 RepID=A0A6G0XKZ4_9STRA|nr:hypothetical protein Ae201684_003768 [Aphanomyces euteiches]KAH9084604.1 hypothetical protein Ae201684P_001846 [Aphanomyces euteiches]KAH9140787.1 hypothetical protein AeRB84_015023 [Aphanomyces euteiches]